MPIKPPEGNNRTGLKDVEYLGLHLDRYGRTAVFSLIFSFGTPCELSLSLTVSVCPSVCLPLSNVHVQRQLQVPVSGCTRRSLEICIIHHRMGWDCMMLQRPVTKCKM